MRHRRRHRQSRISRNQPEIRAFLGFLPAAKRLGHAEVFLVLLGRRRLVSLTIKSSLLKICLVGKKTIGNKKGFFVNCSYIICPVLNFFANNDNFKKS